MERVAIFGLIELTIFCNGSGTLTLSTDLPSLNMQVRETKSIGTTTVSRQVVRYRLQGTTKGRLYSVSVVPVGYSKIHLYGGRIWARLLPETQWAWYPIPIPPTSEQWEARPLPIPPTSEQWEARPLPIPPTSEQWERVALPVKPTPPNPEWVDIPVDQ